MTELEMIHSELIAIAQILENLGVLVIEFSSIPEREAEADYYTAELIPYYVDLQSHYQELLAQIESEPVA